MDEPFSVYLLVRYDYPEGDIEEATEESFRQLKQGHYDDVVLDHTEPPEDEV